MGKYIGYVQNEINGVLFWERNIVIDIEFTESDKRVLHALDYHIHVNRLDALTPIAITDSTGKLLYCRNASPDMLRELPKPIAPKATVMALIE